jgi:hypothetical protein
MGRGGTDEMQKETEGLDIGRENEERDRGEKQNT